MANLESKRLRIRALEPQDIDIIYSWENDPEVWEISSTIAPYSKYLLQKYLEQAHFDIYQTKQMRLMIDLKEKENHYRSIGSIDLFEFDPFHNRIGIGILIKESADRQKGYAREALDILLDYLFRILSVHQVYCNIMADNKPSLELFKKHGFRIIGNKKEWIKTYEGWKDEYLLQHINPYSSS